MSSKLYDLLKGSSLRGLLSNAEIEEVYEELSVDFNDFIEEETERLSDEAKGTTEIKNLQEDITELENKLIEASKSALPNKTLSDTMTTEWIKENWDSISQLYNLNKTGKEIVNTYQYGETLLEMGREAAPEISKMMDREIIRKVITVPIGTKTPEEAEKSLKEVMSSYSQDVHFDETDGQISIDATKTLTNILNTELDKVTNHNRFILVGRAASGKDHMRKMLESRGFKYAVSYTTRPPRTGEVYGKDYFFLSVEEFEKMIADNEFYEYVQFNGWYYGTSNAQFYSDDIFIMTPHGLSCVAKEDRLKSFVMYLDMKEGVRKRRLMERSDVDSVDRRLIADNLDFAEFKDFDVRITNHDF